MSLSTAIQLHRFYTAAGDPIEFHAAPALFPIKRSQADLAFDRLRQQIRTRIDKAFACHERHHLRDIERRFKYADRPDLRVFNQESRRMLGELCIAVLRGEL